MAVQQLLLRGIGGGGGAGGGEGQTLQCTDGQTLESSASQCCHSEIWTGTGRTPQGLGKTPQAEHQHAASTGNCMVQQPAQADR